MRKTRLFIRTIYMVVLFLIVSNNTIGQKCFITPSSTTVGNLEKVKITYILKNNFPPTGTFRIQMPFWIIPQVIDSNLVNYVYALTSRYGKLPVFTVKAVKGIPLSGVTQSRFYIVSFKLKGFPLYNGDTIRFIFGGKKSYRMNLYAGMDTFYIGKDLKSNNINSEIESLPMKIQHGPVYRLMAYSPSNPIVNEPFSITVLALDAYMNLVKNYNGTISFNNIDGIANLPNPYQFSLNDKGSKNFTLQISDKTIHRINIKDELGKVVNVNPIQCKEEGERRIWWGDLHIHSILSGDGFGNLSEILDYARDISKLDFMASTEHINVRKGIVNPSFPYITEIVNQKNVEDEFVVFNGYEWNDSLIRNHKCVYFDGDELGGLYFGNNVTQLYDEVKNSGGLIHSAHPDHNAFPTDWNIFDPEIDRNAEIVGIGWQIYEKPNSLNSTNSSIKESLSMGNVFGFIGCSDSHNPKPGKVISTFDKPNIFKDAAKTAVFSTSRQRKSIFEGIYEKTVYATTGARILLDFKINHKVMGSKCKINKKLPVISSEVHGTNVIINFQLIKNNEVIYSFNPNSRDLNFNYTDSSYEYNSFYYCRVTQLDNEKAWSSPIICEGILDKPKHNSRSSKFNIVPNTSNGKLNLFCDIDVKNNKTVIHIFDMLGRKIYSENTYSEFNEYLGGNLVESLNLNFLESGAYIVEVYIDDKKGVAKFIKP